MIVLNNSSVYLQQLAEFQEEDPKGLQRFLDKQFEEALASYPEGCYTCWCKAKSTNKHKDYASRRREQG